MPGVSKPHTRIALVTGGNRGIGRAIVTTLATLGIDSVLTYRAGAEQAEEVTEQVAALGGKAIAMQLDTGQAFTFATFEASLKERLSAGWGRHNFDFLVNNAGIGASAPIADTSEALLDELIDVNFKGVFLLTQRLAPRIADGGKIVNVVTTSTRVAAGPSAAYASTKGAIEVFTRYLAKELGPRQITANSIAPGATETGFGNGFLRQNPAIAASLADRSALGRVGQAEDPGATIAAFLAAEPNWITGQRIEANGGESL